MALWYFKKSREYIYGSNATRAIGTFYNRSGEVNEKKIIVNALIVIILIIITNITLGNCFFRIRFRSSIIPTGQTLVGFAITL